MRNLLAKVVLVILPAGCDSPGSNKDESAPPVAGSPKKIQAMGSELPAEDEIFLNENWRRLSDSGQPHYDPKSGILEVEYDLGDVTSNGNDSGFFCLPFPFKDTIELNYRVKIAAMRSDSSLTALLMCSPDGTEYLGANFGTVELWQDGSLTQKTPPMDPSRRRSPNYWFSKAGIPGVLMRVTLEPHPNGGGSVAKIWHDVENPAEPITVASVPTRSGLVGFSWSRTKFVISELKVSGKLDQEAAVRMLRAKLKAEAEGTSTGTGR